MSEGGRGADRDDLTVLFVDDYPEYVAAGEEYLETVDDDIEVVPETRAAAALEHVSRERVDCVVCDYQMPEMSGLELLAAVREERPGLPFLLLTGHAPEDVAERAAEEATDVLQKGSGTHTFEAVRTRIRELAPAESDSDSESESETGAESGAEAEFYFDNLTT